MSSRTQAGKILGAEYTEERRPPNTLHLHECFDGNRMTIEQIDRVLYAGHKPWLHGVPRASVRKRHWIAALVRQATDPRSSPSVNNLEVQWDYFVGRLTADCQEALRSSTVAHREFVQLVRALRRLDRDVQAADEEQRAEAALVHQTEQALQAKLRVRKLDDAALVHQTEQALQAKLRGRKRGDAALVHQTEQALQAKLRGRKPTRSQLQRNRKQHASAVKTLLSGGTETEEEAPELELDNHPPLREWTTKPGEEGFNAEATAKMEEYLNDAIGLAQCNAQDLNIYQSTCSWLVHPQSPMKRCLVVHRAGSGKTLTFLNVLNNFYHDPRAKVLIFPTKKTILNFYGELMKWPNRYQDYVLRHKPEWAKLRRDAGEAAYNSQVGDHLGLVRALLEEKGRRLYRKRRPGELPSPLRCFATFETAGGAAAAKGQSIFARVDHQTDRGANPYSQRVVICDEFHNLFEPKDPHRCEEQREHLRQWLTTAENTVLVGATATPFVHLSTAEATSNHVLQVLKGRDGGSNDEGYVVYYNALPPSRFPRRLGDEGSPSMPLTVKPVPLLGFNAKKYRAEQAKIKDAGAPDQQKNKLLKWCNSSNCSEKRIDECRDLAELDGLATKMMEVIRAVEGSTRKQVILAHRKTGLKQLEATYRRSCAIQGVAPTWEFLKGVSGTQPTVAEKQASEDEAERLKSAFNDRRFNLRGERFRVLVANAEHYSEGISFFGVETIHLVDVPPSFAMLVQRQARAIRFCSHDGLSVSEQTVNTVVYVATLQEATPPGSLSTTGGGTGGASEAESTEDQRAFQRLLQDGERFEVAMDRFRAIAVDRLLIARKLEGEDGSAWLPRLYALLPQVASAAAGALRRAVFGGAKAASDDRGA